MSTERVQHTDEFTGELFPEESETADEIGILVMKALSVRQPHANRIASGEKPIETRTWTTKYRGDLLICSSKTGQGEPKGVALCVVELVDIRPMKPSDEEAACVKIYPRAKAWILENLRPLKEPFPVKGELGLYEVELPSSTLY